MKICLVSDLHLEFGDYHITNDKGCDVLILGGDICVARDLYDHPEPINPLINLGTRQTTAQRYRKFLQRCSLEFPHVIYIAGNHEFYHGKWQQTLKVLADECAQFPNVYFLECDTKKIDDVVFIGGTLWTDMNGGDPLTMHAIRDTMNDFRLIRVETADYRKMSPVDTVVRHKQMLQYIKHVIMEKPDTKFVVVGHHAPSKLSTHPNYKNEYLMNSAYSSDLSEFILDHPQIVLWTHGHTHHPFDYVLGQTRVVCNPRGYVGYESTNNYQPKILEL